MGKPGKKLQAEPLVIMQKAQIAHSAYDLLEELKGRYPKIATTTVYRALVALIDYWKVHRLESLKAFIACKHERHDLPSIFSIRKDCRAVEKNFEPGVFFKLSSALKNTGFSVQHHVVEVNGICARCEL